jgi:exopolysaccharide biosynthesis predicted pyruvyltransferase EpsI
LRRDHESALISLLEDTGDDGDVVLPDTRDITKSIADDVTSAMASLAPTKSFRVVDWPDRLSIFHSEDELFTGTSIQLLSLGRVVICDRLHAAILAFLAGLPFVYIDQSTGKISKSLKVAFDSKSCHSNAALHSMWYNKGQNLTDAIQKGVELLKLTSAK